MVITEDKPARYTAGPLAERGSPKLGLLLTQHGAPDPPPPRWAAHDAQAARLGAVAQHALRAPSPGPAWLKGPAGGYRPLLVPGGNFKLSAFSEVAGG